jgi:cytochrome P450
MMNDQTSTPRPDTLFDGSVQQCPYDFYDKLREEAPVYKDPVTGIYVVTRYDLVRQVLMDPDSFIASRRDDARDQIKTLHQQAIVREFQEKGWVPGKSVGQYDEPDHGAVRSIFDNTFRAGKMKDFDDTIRMVLNELFDSFIDSGKVEWISQVAIPLPMMVFATQMGAPREDLAMIRHWTDAWVSRLGMMLPPDKEMETVRLQIEAQHYFQPRIEALRGNPDGSFFSDLVNMEVPGWGRTLTDNEIHAHLMGDTFVGGGETTSNAFGGGIRLLIENPDVWERLKADPEKHLNRFVEEMLRLESPVQGLTRFAARDVELAGVAIPAGSTVGVQYAAANRDPERFPMPAKFDMDRKNAGAHLAFGSGVHHCLGAALARRELYWCYHTVVERFDRFWLSPEQEGYEYEPNLFLRRMKTLHLEFTPRS